MNTRDLLKIWCNQAIIYRVLHATAANYYLSLYSKYQIPALIITAASAAFSFSVQVFPKEVDLYVPTLVGVLNLVAGTYTAICNFRKIPQLAESNRVASVQFSQLHRKIQQRLVSAAPEEDLKEFANSVREDLDNLIEAGPLIPNAIVRAFRDKHKDSEIKLPAIVNLGGLEIHKERHHRHASSIGDLFRKLTPRRSRPPPVQIDSKRETKINVVQT